MISSMGGYRCCHIQFWNMVIMEKEKRYVASISGGKDSMAMVLGLMEKGWPLTHCVYFDTGMEFSCIRKNIEKVRLELEQYGCELVILQPERHFLEEMLLRRIKCRDGSSHYGSYWCGGPCRWMTRLKINACEKYVKSLGATAVEYIGIAADESGRVKEKCYPLVEWGWTEYQCLQYCYAKGYNWLEGGIELYSILDRVSCWCCRNKNLRELNAIYHNLPQYWDKLRALQSYIEEPYKPPYTIFDLEERFANAEYHKRLKRLEILEADITLDNLLERNGRKNDGTTAEYFAQAITRQQEQGKINTATKYRFTLVSLQKVLPLLKFDELTLSHLHNPEQKLHETDCSANSTAAKISVLKVVYKRQNRQSAGPFPSISPILFPNRTMRKPCLP